MKIKLIFLLFITITCSRFIENNLEDEIHKDFLNKCIIKSKKLKEDI
jgi:hypothetical protein